MEKLKKLQAIANRIDTADDEERAELEMLFVHNLKQLLFSLPSLFRRIDIMNFKNILVIHDKEA